MARVDLYQQEIKSWDGKVFKTSADLDVWLRFSLIKDVGIITKKLISYRLSKSSYTYRTKFTRVVPRDMFRVVDYYMNKYSALDFNMTDYAYLRFKDNIMVISNRILQEIVVTHNEIKLFNLDVIRSLVFSKQKMQIYVYALIIKIGLYLHLKKPLSRFVGFINRVPDNINFYENR